MDLDQLVLVTCFLALSDIAYSVEYLRKADVEERLKNISYNPTENPDYPSATNVSIRLHFYNIHSISDTDMDFTAELYFILQWRDKRLQKLWDFLETDKTNKTFFPSWKTIKEIWRPNVYFTNEKSAALHSVPERNEVMYIHSNGTVTYNMRLSVKHPCPMMLNLYPFDWQKCKILIESYSYKDDFVRLFWQDKGVQPPDTQSRHFDLFPKGRYSCKTDDTLAGNFSALSFEFILKRRSGYCFLNLFVPSGMIVILSWISFLIDPQIVVGRLSFGSVCYLTMISLDASTQNNLPSVSYMKIIDIWMLCCQLFVFLALIEFAVVYYRYVFLSKKDMCVPQPGVKYGSIANEDRCTCKLAKSNETSFTDKSASMSQSVRTDRSKYGCIENEDRCTCKLAKSNETSFTDKSALMSQSVRIDRSVNQKVNENTEGERNTNKANVVDKWSRGIFPAVFIIFLIIYAVIVWQGIQNSKDDLLGTQLDHWIPFNRSEEPNLTIPCVNKHT